MIEALMTVLIYACVLALVVYLIIWVLGIIGVALPEKVVQLIWVIVALIVVLLLVRALLGTGLRLSASDVILPTMI